MSSRSLNTLAYGDASGRQEIARQEDERIIGDEDRSSQSDQRFIHRRCPFGIPREGGGGKRRRGDRGSPLAFRSRFLPSSDELDGAKEATRRNAICDRADHIFIARARLITRHARFAACCRINARTRWERCSAEHRGPFRTPKRVYARTINQRSMIR